MGGGGWYYVPKVRWSVVNKIACYGGDEIPGNAGRNDGTGVLTRSTSR